LIEARFRAWQRGETGYPMIDARHAYMLLATRLAQLPDAVNDCRLCRL
jgi:hypothetical protein